MAVIDIIFFALFALIVIHAALRGFIEELTATAWLFGGIFFGAAFFREGGVWIRAHGLENTGFLPELLSFLLLFLIAFLAINIVGAMIRDIITRAGLATLDKVLGIVFGIIKGIVVVAVIILVLRFQPLFNGGELLQNSVIARILNPLTSRGYGIIGTIFV